MSNSLLRPRGVAATLAVLALATAGCGADPGRDDPAAARPTSPAKAAFVEQGNKVLCVKSRRVTAATLAHVLRGRDSAAEELTLVREEVLPALRTAYEGLTALPAPPGDGPVVAVLLGSMRAALRAADRDPALVLSDHDPFERVDRELAGYGLDGCA
jgi:hypothetical protein